jgi:ABC-type transporter Mla subunit MlaD
MVQIEAYLDNELRAAISGIDPALARPGFAGNGAGQNAQLQAVVAEFGAATEQLHATVANFEAALRAFAGTTRDFREFNLHLKDNVQRMSLSFGDLSETLKEQVGTLRRRE